MAQGFPAEGTIGANGVVVPFGDAHNEFASQYAVQVIGTFTGTIEIQGSLDGTTFVPLLLRPSNSDTGVANLAAAGVWRVDASGLAWVQAKSTAWTSGTATIYAKPVQG